MAQDPVDILVNPLNNQHELVVKQELSSEENQEFGSFEEYFGTKPKEEKFDEESSALSSLIKDEAELDEFEDENTDIYKVSVEDIKSEIAESEKNAGSGCSDSEEDEKMWESMTQPKEEEIAVEAGSSSIKQEEVIIKDEAEPYGMPEQITRRSIFEIWVSHPKKNKQDAIRTYILQKLDNPLLSDNASASIQKTVQLICYKIGHRWAKSGRHTGRFLKCNKSWLDATINLSYMVYQEIPSTSRDSTNGRPGSRQKSFCECSYKSKKRKIQHLVDSASHEELSLATAIKLHNEGKRDSASIIKKLSTISPKHSNLLKKATQSLNTEKPKGLSADQALAMLVDAKLTTHQYEVIQGQVSTINSKLYPPYYLVKDAKKQCYPAGISISETSAEIELQALIDHTVTRVYKAQEDVFKTLNLNELTINIIIKWGCDGSEQSRFKQKFTEDQGASDESLFSISMVPIQIYCNKNNYKKVIWQNPSPSSTRYCRPIKFVFAKASTDLITREVKIIEDKISLLSPTKLPINNMEVFINPTMIFCMIDGQICNAVSSCASTQTCYLCNAKPSEMNNPSVILKKNVNQKLLSFGLSPLHSWIRFLECILHLSYKIDIKSWQAKGAENQEKVNEKKKFVQDKFRKELGLLVDMPKQQFGNTNDGNTARTFFRNAEKAAEITGVNENLIKRFHVILECLGSGFRINLNKFEEYVKKTRELYLAEYSWYPMPVTVHKILFHGRDIIASCILPIGQFSEEAQEARDKHCRQYRELFTRKTSRKDTNIDLLNRLLITSDPYIASLRASPKTQHGKITAEVLYLLEDSDEM